MRTLAEYIKSHPEKNPTSLAREFGISRPYLYALVDGTRNPSLDVAKRIASATGGSVRVQDWPNIAAVIEAAGKEA